MKFNVDKIQEPLLKASMWVQNNTILQAVKNAFVRTIPFTVIGSFSNLIKMQLDALIKAQHLHWGWLSGNSDIRDRWFNRRYIQRLFLCGGIETAR